MVMVDPHGDRFIIYREIQRERFQKRGSLKERCMVSYGAGPSSRVPRGFHRAVTTWDEATTSSASASASHL